VENPVAFPNNIKCPGLTFVLGQITREALVVFASRDDSRHFPQQEDAIHDKVQFDNNVPVGKTLTNLINKLTPDKFVNGVLLAFITPPDAEAEARAAVVAKIVNNTNQHSPASTVKSRTGPINPTDIRRLTDIGASLEGIDEVIFLEKDPTL
jgi:hypothetical protein